MPSVTRVAESQLDVPVLRNRVTKAEQNIDFTRDAIEDLTGDGNKMIFTVPTNSYKNGTLIVYINGFLCRKKALPILAVDFAEENPSMGTYKFGQPPISGDVIAVFYEQP